MNAKRWLMLVACVVVFAVVSRVEAEQSDEGLLNKALLSTAGYDEPVLAQAYDHLNYSSVSQTGKLRLVSSSRPRCEPTGRPGDCYGNGSACKAVLLVCYGCCYDEKGYLKNGENAELCGVCVGWDF